MASEEELRREKIERLNKLGIPVPVSNNSTVTSSGTDKFQLLEQIKRGHQKNRMNELMHSEKQVNKDFTPLPTVRKNKKNQPNAKTENLVALESFAPQSSGELGAVSELFEERSTSFVNTPGLPNKTIYQEEQPQQLISENPDNYNLGGDPLLEFKKRMEEKKKQTENPVKQVIQETEQRAVEYIPVNNDAGITKDMIYEIASKVSEKKIKEVLENFVKTQAQKKTFEYYDKSKNIVKIDNKLFILKEVMVKKKE